MTPVFPRPARRLLFCALRLALLCCVLSLMPAHADSGELVLYSDTYQLPPQRVRVGQGIVMDQLVACGALLQSVHLDSLGQPVYAEETELYGMDVLYYDPELDAYYLEPATLLNPAMLPAPVRMDVFYNGTAFAPEASAWAWGYALNTAIEAFWEEEDRWYLDDFDPGQSDYGQLYVLYRTPVTLYTLTFLDTDGSTLASHRVLENGLVGSAAGQHSLQALVPPEMAERYDGWLTPAGEPISLPQRIARPATWVARYKPVHPVSFFLDDPSHTPYHAMEAIEGTYIDWTAVPSPVREGTVFTGWQAVPPLPADAPVTGPLSYVAQWESLCTVTFLDADGLPHHTLTLPEGAPLDLAAIDPPQRENLTFAHWLDESGRPFATNTVLTGDRSLTPAYTATVRFLDGAREHARLVVAAGTCLSEEPESPQADAGYLFVGWDMALAETPILAHTTVHALYDVLVTYRFGLAGEQVWVDQQRAGSAASPPDAAEPGYTYAWVPSLVDGILHEPMTLHALYTPIQYTVRFLGPGPDGTETLYAEHTVAHGTTPLFPPNPTLEGYRFLGWDWPDLQSDGLVTSDLAIRALFEAVRLEEIPPNEIVPDAPEAVSTSGGSAAAWTDDASGLWNAIGEMGMPVAEDGVWLAEDTGPRYHLLADDLPMHGIVSGTVAECME